MNRKLKRIIALILCVTLIVGIDNFTGFSSVFQYIHHQMITKGETQPQTETVTEGSSDDSILESNGTEEEVTTPQQESTTLGTDAAAPEQEETTTPFADTEEPVTEKESEVRTETIMPEMAMAASDGIQLTEATELVAGGIYLIKSYADWTKLSQVSQTATLEDMTFIVYKRDAQYDDWTLSNLKIGCKEYPFSGTLYSYYSTTTIYTNVILFDYLSSKAHIGIKDKGGIKTFVLSYTANVPAGLANNLVLDKAGCEVHLGEDGESNYYVKVIKGNITSNMEAGGLFANVYVEDNAVSLEGSAESIYKITIAGTGIDLSGITNKAVTGKTAGGLIGVLSGDIDVKVISLPTQMTTVTSTSVAAGSLIGKVADGAEVVFQNTEMLTLSSNTTGTGYVGGLIGYMENAGLNCTTGIRRTGNTTGSKYAGGLVGYVYNSTVVVADYTQNNNTYVYQNTTGSATANLGVGGVIGKYYHDDAVKNDRLELSYIKTENKDAKKASNIKITAANNQYNKVGGLVGIIYSGTAEVYIHDMNTDTESAGENSYNVNMIYNNNSTSTSTVNETGGLAGIIAGENIRIENIIFNYQVISAGNGVTSNAMGGNLVGDIAARVGYVDNKYVPSKLVVRDVKVAENYVYIANTYHGGLFAFVGQSVIALQGNIDLSGVPYKTVANSQRWFASPVLLATLRNRGFVAGYAAESLIYLDMDSQYTRPVHYDEDGNIQEFNANVISYTNVNSANSNSTYLYCIDDIGNYGSVFRNVENVLDITRNMDSIVTGKVDKNESGQYIIDTLGDALRLAVAGNTVQSDGYPRFGGNCFVNDGEAVPKLNDILAGHYLIANNLSLGEAGIHGFVENNDINRYPFTGTFEGVKNAEGGNPVITMDFVSRQKYGGLFPTAGNSATFKNLDIKGNVCFLGGGADSDAVSNYQVRAGAGSLAAYATGTITVDNVNIYTNMKNSLNSHTQWDNGNMYCYGGMFGYYYPAGGSYSCTNSIIAPNFTSVRSNAHNGGMIGWVRINNSSRLTDMTVRGCTLSTKITSNSAYTMNCSTFSVHGREAGLISMISDSFYNVSTTQNNVNYPAAVADATYGTIHISDLKIDDTRIDLTTTHATNNDVKISGGLLGYAWTQVDVDIEGLSIENAVFNSRGYVGGLISFAAGKYNLKDIDIRSLKMEHVRPQYYASYDKSGFLIGNGQNAFVTIQNYHIANDGNVTYTNYATFDEIVGISLRLYRSNGQNGAEAIASPGGTVENSYSSGGIVNIIDEDFQSFTDGTYQSYVNQVVTEPNKFTRYYYNLFTEGADWNIPVSGGTGTVSSPEQWLAFSVASYAKESLARYFKPYLGDNAISSISTINIDNDLDMNGYSVYPTPLSGNKTIDGGNHTITLYGENISELEAALKDNGVHSIDRNNELNTTQHYMMHAGLFNEVSGTQKIQNLTLTGTAANIGTYSGALITGYANGVIHIKDITISDLRISHYNDTRCGLLVSHIGTNTYHSNITANVTLDGITTVYSAGGALPAGAALIGYVGSDDATDVRVIFKNMRVEDEKTADKSSGKVFKYASYVYDYQYTNNSDENRCYMLYTFLENDCKNGNVTFGEEIRAGVQYYDRNRDKTDTTDLLNIAIQNAVDGVFIPYVFTERNIYVNPRNGNITEGCGTYEDPYQITNAKQFLTLYLYLTGKTEYDTMFWGTGTADDASGVWKVVPIGGDGNGAGCSNGGIGGTHTTSSYGDADFPSRDDMRTAYYQISADILLGEEDDMNDKYIAGEFCGLGSSDYPFAGVIIGSNDSGNYTVTLPKQGTRNIIVNGQVVQEQIEQSTLGLIQYMSGAVIKDLNIQGEGYNDNAYYNITDSAGGVAAKIVGGDNIIDNVTVSLNMNTNNKYIQSDGTGGISGLGGYVGVIENGSLILRNIQGNQVVGNCLFGDFSKGTVGTYAVYQEYAAKLRTLFQPTAKDGISGYSEDTYTGNYDELVGMLIGRIYDGYAVYEGWQANGGEEPKVLRRNELNVSDAYTTQYPLVNGFHIINGNVLDAATVNGRFTFTKTDNNYHALIKNEDQLEILALALNSDAFSVLWCNRNDHVTGYGYKTKCRRATYEDVGRTGAAASSDRTLAVTYDDNKAQDIGYLYPYICYKYMDYTALSTAGTTALTDSAFDSNNYEGYKTTLSEVTRTETVNNKSVEITNIISNINKTVPEVANYTTSYELEEKSDEADKLFDVSEYDISFRGIGAIYTKTYSDFRGNFNGNGNSVKFYIDRRFDDTILYSGMFNQLTYNQKVIDKNISDTQLEIQNFTIQNSIVYNPNKFKEIDTTSASSNYIVQHGIQVCATGGVAGVVQGAWKFENITLKRNEAITDDTITSDVSGYRDVGGFIGRINNTTYASNMASAAWMNENYPKSNEIDIIHCNIEGTDTVKVRVTELGSTRGKTEYAGYRHVSVGGFVGGIGTNLYVNNSTGVYGSVDFIACDITHLTVSAENKGNMGGFAGSIGIRFNVDNTGDSGWAAMGSVTVDGSCGKCDNSDNSHKRKNGSITDMELVSRNTADDYSAGGIFGRIDTPRASNYPDAVGVIDVRNYVLDTVTIHNDRTNVITTRVSLEGVGGIIGYIRGNTLLLYNLHVTKGSQVGDENTGLDAGGLVGNLRPPGNSNNNYYQYKIKSSVSVDNCTLENSKILSNCGITGGLLGMAHTDVLSMGSEADADNSKAATSNEVSSSEIKNKYVSSGGLVGQVYSNYLNTTGFKATIINATTKDTKVEGGTDGAGGIVGRGVVDIGWQSYLTIQDACVYSSADAGTKKAEITGNSYTGGIVGAVGTTSSVFVQLTLSGLIGVGAYYKENQWKTAADNGVNLKGQYTGGVIGYENARYSENYAADIFVANNRIYSYVDSTGTYPNTYSGGIFGYRNNYEGVENKYDSVTVKNNIIFTGANNSARSREWGSVGCGGLYGYIYNNNKTNTYLPYVTLENNSIGYYNVEAANKATDWNTVTLDSSDVQLYDASAGTLKSVSWDKIENLSDSNIGNYAVAFGQFIGRQYATHQTSQVFILRPEVKTDNTVGSIPVIDVGSNTWAATANQSTVTYGEGAPYLYRKNCHIVYMDNPTANYADIASANAGRKPNYIDSSLLINSKAEYHFGDFEDIVTEYQNLNTGVTDVAEKNYNFITAKRLNMYMPYNDDVTKYSLCTGANNYYNLTYNVLNDSNMPANLLNGVPVLILDGLDPQSVGDYAAAILTNGGGVVSNAVVESLGTSWNTTMDNFWQIECQNAYIDVDGTIKPVDTTNPIFSDHKVSSVQLSKGGGYMSNNKNRLKLAESLYDEIIQLEGSNDSIYTITLLSYTYTCPTAVSEKQRTETIYIPVFVKEKVTMNSYIRILSNEEYSFNEAAHNGYKDEVHISHDSTYTIFAEFIYDKIRLKDSFKNDKINKSINFDTTVNVITAGTKFTLIDYASGKAYYYTADGTENNNIPFADFADEDGNLYEQCNISDGITDNMCKDTYTSIGYQENNTQVAGTDKYENVGIERFFIVVEPPDEENNSVFYLNIKADAVDINGKAVDEFFNKNPYGDKQGIQVTYIPGPTIGFGGIDDDTGYGTEGVTYIKGKISREELVSLDANVEVVLKDSLSPYWEEKVSGNTIDSSNSGKYLEVAVTLLDENNDIVAWPSGTNISFNGGPKQVLENNLIVYMYKDIEKIFPMDTIDNNLENDCYYYNINEDESNPDMRWIHKDEDGNFFYYTFNPTDAKWLKEYPGFTELQEDYLSISNQCNVTLDFSVADIEDYSGKNYTVMMKLYRSDSPEYPNEGTTKSYGDAKRQYSSIITGESKRELAAAISADDLMDLGINLYARSQNVYDIPFTNKFDFSGLIHRSKAEADIQECAGKKYMVTYRLYKKVAADGTTDIPDYGVGYNENIANIISRSSEYQYEIMNWEDAPFKLYDISDTDTPLSSTNITVNGDEAQSVIITTKEFTEDEIKNGTSGIQYVTDWGMNLEVDTTDMGNEDLTNYMITATYIPYDSDDSKPATDEQQTLFDYFIFTIAKLKTDL